MSESSFHLSSSGSERKDDRPARASYSAGSKRPRSLSAAASVRQRRVRRVKKGYIELLNQCIRDTRYEDEDPDALPPSQIGASFWTSTEKSAFFNTLQRVGPGDIPRLSAAIHTKSLPEVLEYLRLLQAGAIEAEDIDPRFNDAFTVADVPAAAEVSRDCEEALDEVAQTLSIKMDQREQQLLKDAYGENWLIDEALAERLEEEYDQPSDEADHDGHQVGMESNFPAADLLSAQNFLRLSNTVFMNGPPGTGNNWSDYGSEMGPALYRNAFEDFHSLAVNLTKRLVQATLFQAMSRIRAMDADTSHNYTPQLRVASVDVNTANQILGVRSDRRSYWAKLPRTFDIDVYSESKKYNDGRPRTKWGYKISHDEAEEELDLPTVLAEATAGSDSEVDSGALIIDDEEDDRYTESNEDDHLENIDRQASREEERRLWDLAAPAKRHFSDGESNGAVRPRFAKQARAAPWRQRCNYEPEWSRFDQQVHQSGFDKVHARGKKEALLAQDAAQGPSGRRRPPDTHMKREPLASEDEDGHDDDGTNVPFKYEVMEE